MRYDDYVDYGGVLFIFCMLSFLVLILLKIIGYVTVSWWWITAPLWIPVGLFAVMLLGYVIVISIKYILGRKNERNG